MLVHTDMRTVAFVILPLLVLACDNAKEREEWIAAPVPTAKPEPAAAPEPAGPPPDPALLDGMLVGEPTWLWSPSEKLFACAAATRKGENVTYSFSAYDPAGKRVGDPAQLVQGAREFASKRRPADVQLAKGFTALTRTPWPKQSRSFALADRELQWTDAGELAVVAGKQTLATTALPRKDMVPVAVHVGGPPEAVLVEVKFDPKDKQAMNVGYTDCVVVPTPVAAERG